MKRFLKDDVSKVFDQLQPDMKPKWL